MKLVVGKKYVLRNRPDISCAYVIAAADHRIYDFEVRYAFVNDTVFCNEIVHYMKSGRYLAGDMPSDQDLVAEYVPTEQAAATTTGALAYDEGKTRFDLLPVEALEEICKVFAAGAVKYTVNGVPGDHNWRKGFAYSRIFNSLLRHVFAALRGEDRDPETGLLHMAHAGCRVLMILSHMLCGLGIDDRYKPFDRRHMIKPSPLSEEEKQLLDEGGEK